MDEIWERAVETALDGQTDVALVRTLTLDGAVKCVHGRLPQPSLFEKFHNLQHLSVANIGVSSLEQFPRLQNLQKLILSDNRIAGGLEFLVVAGLGSLRDLDLSNNRIQDINDLRPLAELRLVSLDLYECPVTRVKDYRSRVFGLIRSLKYLDKMDAEENERPESDDEEEEDEEEDDEDDPGSGEVDGEEKPFSLNNGHSGGGSEGIVDVDEDEESDADEEETETSRGRGANGLSRGGALQHHTNGFRVEGMDGDDDDEDNDEGEGEDEEDNDSVEEIDEDEGDDEDVVVVHEVEDSDDEEDGVEDDEDEDDEDDVEEEDEEEVDNDEGDFVEPESTGRLTSTEGEIDGHEQGEDVGDEDDEGETGEDEQGVEEEGEFEDEEDAEDEEEDYGGEYLVQPVVGQVEVDGGDSDMKPVNGDEDPVLEEEVDDEEDDEDGEIQEMPPSNPQKRRRDEDNDDDDEGDDDDVVGYSKSSKHR